MIRSPEFGHSTADNIITLTMSNENEFEIARGVREHRVADIP